MSVPPPPSVIRSGVRVMLTPRSCRRRAGCGRRGFRFPLRAHSREGWVRHKEVPNECLHTLGLRGHVALVEIGDHNTSGRTPPKLVAIASGDTDDRGTYLFG